MVIFAHANFTGDLQLYGRTFRKKVLLNYKYISAVEEDVHVRLAGEDVDIAEMQLDVVISEKKPLCTGPPNSRTGGTKCTRSMKRVDFVLDCGAN
jgi:hypothetical protein